MIPADDSLKSRQDWFNLQLLCPLRTQQPAGIFFPLSSRDPLSPHPGNCSHSGNTNLVLDNWRGTRSIFKPFQPQCCPVLGESTSHHSWNFLPCLFQLWKASVGAGTIDAVQKLHVVPKAFPREQGASRVRFVSLPQILSPVIHNNLERKNREKKEDQLILT